MAADQAHVDRAIDGRDDVDDIFDLLSSHDNQRHAQEKDWKRLDDVGHPHQELRKEATVVTGDQPKRDSQYDSPESAQDRDGQVGPRRGDHPREDIHAIAVGAHKVAEARRLKLIAWVSSLGIKWADDRANCRKDDCKGDDDRADESGRLSSDQVAEIPGIQTHGCGCGLNTGSGDRPRGREGPSRGKRAARTPSSRGPPRRRPCNPNS